MRRLMITVLVSTFVFGMVGMAEAALVPYAEIYSGISLNKDFSIKYLFDLSASGNIATVYNKNNPTTTTNSPNPDISSYVILSSTGQIDSAHLSISSIAGSPYLINLYDVTQAGSVANTPFYTASSYSGSIDLISDSTNLLDGKILVEIKNTYSGRGNSQLSIGNVSLNVTTVPLPAAGLLLSSGLIGLIGVRRRQAV